MRKYYLKLQSLNQAMVAEHCVRCNNHEQLLRTLRELNKTIEKGAKLRGKFLNRTILREWLPNSTISETVIPHFSIDLQLFTLRICKRSAQEICMNCAIDYRKSISIKKLFSKFYRSICPEAIFKKCYSWRSSKQSDSSVSKCNCRGKFRDATEDYSFWCLTTWNLVSKFSNLHNYKFIVIFNAVVNMTNNN